MNPLFNREKITHNLYEPMPIRMQETEISFKREIKNLRAQSFFFFFFLY